MTWDAGRERFVLENGVRLQRGSVVLRARTASYDPKTGEVDATTDVLLTAPGRAVGADGIHAVLDGPWEARGVIAFFKSTAAESRPRAPTIAAAGSDGRNRLTLQAERAGGRCPGATPPDASPPRRSASRCATAAAAPPRGRSAPTGPRWSRDAPPR